MPDSRVAGCIAVAVALYSRNGDVALAVTVVIRPPSRRGLSRSRCREHSSRVLRGVARAVVATIWLDNMDLG